MEELRYTAFTTDPSGGNPAGVVLADALPDDADMQAIAARIGFSETAFVDAGDGAGRYAIRYFSPEREVTFCGHATIAMAVALGERHRQLDRVVFRTRTDEVPVALERADGRVRATLSSPPASSSPVSSGILDAALGAFGWSRDVLDPALPPTVAQAGAVHLVLPVAAEQTLRAMRYDFDALKRLMLAENWTTVAVVWREQGGRFHARNPFPVGGVVEDPATGAAAAAFGGYLRDHGAISPPATFTILQGRDIGRPSVLTVALEPGEPGVRVTGDAVAMEAPQTAMPVSGSQS